MVVDLLRVENLLSPSDLLSLRSQHIIRGGRSKNITLSRSVFWTAGSLVARAIRNAIRANRFTRIDSRESFAIETPILIARQADSPESLEFSIRANHATKGARRGGRTLRRATWRASAFQVPSMTPPLLRTLLRTSVLTEALTATRRPLRNLPRSPSSKTYWGAFYEAWCCMILMRSILGGTGKFATRFARIIRNWSPYPDLPFLGVFIFLGVF